MCLAMDTPKHSGNEKKKTALINAISSEKSCPMNYDRIIAYF